MTDGELDITTCEHGTTSRITFVTGHPEYSFAAHSVHPSGFLAKPVCEQDILRELRELRFPLDPPKSSLKVQCRPFAVFVNGEPLDFKRDRTIELLAYLILLYGSCSHGSQAFLYATIIQHTP